MNFHVSTAHVRLFFLALLLPLGACSDDAPTTNKPTSPLIGTWILMKSNGLNVSAQQTYYTFTQTQVVYTADEGCKVTSDYTQNRDTVYGTTVSDECFGIPAGGKDTATYVIAGDQLTLNASGTVSELTKGTPKPIYLSGIWSVETIDGKPLATGEGVIMTFTRTTLTIARTGSAPCTESYDYSKEFPGQLGLTRTADGCNNNPVGEASTAAYSITATSLSVTIDGIAYVAKR